MKKQKSRAAALYSTALYSTALLSALLLLSSLAHAQWTDRHINNTSRQYDEVSWAIAHNAFNSPQMYATSTDAGGKNQQWGIATQLENGIRGLQIDVHYGLTRNVGKGYYVYLAHGASWHWMGVCEIFLPQIKKFLEKHKREIITLRIQPAFGAGDTRHVVDAFHGRGHRCRSSADVSEYLYRSPPQALGKRTIQSLINANERLIVMTEKRTAAMPSWMIDEFGAGISFQNLYKASHPNHLYEANKFDIDHRAAARGDRYAAMLTVNNFATDPPLAYGNASKSRDANASALRKARDSWFAFAKRPSLTADFVDEGNFMREIATLNRLHEVKGRFVPAGGGMSPTHKLHNVKISTNTMPRGLKIYGAQAYANGAYSFPAIKARDPRATSGDSSAAALAHQPHKITTIKFSHPQWSFYPQAINLTKYAGASSKVARQDVHYWRKTEPTPATVKKLQQAN
ncbi:MAG: hypothetical protein ACR2P7_10200 [bacterium]